MLIGNMQVSNLAIVLPNHVDNFEGWIDDPELGTSTKPSKNNIAIILAAFSLA